MNISCPQDGLCETLYYTTSSQDQLDDFKYRDVSSE